LCFSLLHPHSEDHITHKILWVVEDAWNQELLFTLCIGMQTC
jgi:hypothetical protein